LGLARGFCYGERICVILGDNIFENEITEIVEDYNLQERGARIVLKPVHDPTRYGVAIISNDRIVDIVEKPDQDFLTQAQKEHVTCSELAVTGIYFYDQRVFEIIDTLKPSGRGELEITDVNNAYREWGQLKYSILGGWWTDAGTHESLKKSNELVTGTKYGNILQKT
jgi:glucose-1-phosphate thymidylyltransferase